MLRCLLVSIPAAFVRERGAHYRAHGSFLVPFAEAAANFLGSKPVMEGRGAIMDAANVVSNWAVEMLNVQEWN
jgi:hypothetical protein